MALKRVIRGITKPPPAPAPKRVVYGIRKPRPKPAPSDVGGREPVSDEELAAVNWCEHATCNHDNPFSDGDRVRISDLDPRHEDQIGTVIGHSGGEPWLADLHNESDPFEVENFLYGETYYVRLPDGTVYPYEKEEIDPA